MWFNGGVSTDNLAFCFPLHVVSSYAYARGHCKYAAAAEVNNSCKSAASRHVFMQKYTAQYQETEIGAFKAIINHSDAHSMLSFSPSETVMDLWFVLASPAEGLCVNCELSHRRDFCGISQPTLGVTHRDTLVHKSVFPC